MLHLGKQSQISPMQGRTLHSSLKILLHPPSCLYLLAAMGNMCTCGDIPQAKAETLKELTLNGVIVSLARGNPASETSDVIMLCLDGNLHPTGPAASVTLKAAGVGVAQRIKEKWREGGLAPGTVFVTDAGKLAASEILHVVCPEEASVQAVQGVYAAIIAEVVRRGHQTAVITPLQASEEVPLAKQAELCIQVLAETLRSKKSHKVQRIRLVTPTMEVARAFEQEFDRYFPKWIHSKPEVHLSKPISN